MLLFSLNFISCTTYNNTQWVTDRGSIGHFASVNTTIEPPLNVRWRQQLSGPIVAPVVGNDQFIYVSAGNTMYCLNPNNGEIVWTRVIEATISNAATVISQNKGQSRRIYFVAENSSLYCLNADNGDVIWTRVGSNQNSNSFNSPTNYASGVLYYSYMFSGVSSKLRAVSAESGDVLWESEPMNITTNTPLHGVGKIFYGGCEESTRAIEAYNPANGTTMWSTNNPLDNSSVCFANGVIDYDVNIGQEARYIFSLGGTSAERPKIFAVNPANGNPIWENVLSENGQVTGFALSQNTTNNSLIVTQMKAIYCLNPTNGSELWRKSFTANSFYSRNKRTPQPAIAGNIVYHVCNRNQLKAFNKSNGEEMWSYEIGNTYSSPVVGDKTIYIGNENGMLYAFSR